MYLYFLGTGAGLPSKARNVTSIALCLFQERGSFWLFDCGEATQHQIMRSPLKLSRLERIFITHMHGDHVYGLPGLVTSRSFQTDRPLVIFGPQGTENYVRTVLSVSEAHITYPLSIHEWSGEKSTVFEDDTFSVEAGMLSHGVLSLGYRVVQKPLPGRLNVERLRADNVPPGPIYKLLKQGKTALLEDGRVIAGEDYISPMQPGRVVAILGDTTPCPTSRTLADGADVLVHEATFSSPDRQLAASYGHSTATEAAETAVASNVNQLILTHFSARYHAPDALLREAGKIFPRTLAAADHLTVEIP